MYIHQKKTWPHFIRDSDLHLLKISTIRHKQGQILGSLRTVGFDLKLETQLEILAQDIITSNAIEGNVIDPTEVRSSIAKRLGIQKAGLISTTHYMDGLVDMMIDATQNFHLPLSKDRLCGWHCCLFPTGRSGMYRITVGDWRTDQDGPMQVISGGMGREKIHFEAPQAHLLEEEMTRFIKWFNEADEEPIIKSAIAHLWFVTLHPFDDGNGRIARTLSDVLLSRSDQSPFRFYSMSAQIEKEKHEYYRQLEIAQRGTLEINAWIKWYLNCLDHALDSSKEILDSLFVRTLFWEVHREVVLNARQKKMIMILLDGFVGKLKSSKWAKMTKCSQDTALRDIKDLMEKGILKPEEGGGRSQSYQLVLPEVQSL